MTYFVKRKTEPKPLPRDEEPTRIMTREELAEVIAYAKTLDEKEVSK